MYVQSLQCSNTGPITVKKAQDFTVTLQNGIRPFQIGYRVQHQAVLVHHNPQYQCRKEIHKSFKHTARILFLSGQGHTGNVLGRDASLEHRVTEFIAAAPVHEAYGKIPFAPYSVCHFLAESPGYGRINASLFQVTFQCLMTQFRHFHVLESGNAGYLLTFL